MDTLQGRVAVITGAASGIGLAMAKRFAQHGMKVVLADVEAEALERAADGMRASGTSVLSKVCDVSDRAHVAELADATYAEFGACHVLCNNAGVVGHHASWSDLDTWDWVLGVDLMGVIYGVNAFVPRMLDSGEPGHIINTASTAGLLSFPGIASYNVAKHGVVALSQTMHFELHKTELNVSVMCPGLVSTNIGSSDRNRPGRDADATPAPPGDGGITDSANETLTPDQVAEEVHQAITEGSFWILPHPHYAEQALEQAERRTRNEGPVLPRINR